ncbi:MAG TPA: glycosyltransferase [Polyangiaceae bacterium]|nr:glycosyltransferase [Polyangiaceae bacterium]
MAPSESIPNRLHFVWFGEELPCFAALALKSARAKNPTATVRLWHEAGLRVDARVQSLEAAGVERVVLDVGALLSQTLEQAAAPRALERIWHVLTAPAARSNVVRLLILYLEGGIYLDTDTLTLQNLDQLRHASAFCGLEHILWSTARSNKRHPYYWTAGPLLSGLRLATGYWKEGYRFHGAQLRWYDRAANNAVLGFTAGHPFLRRAFTRMGALAEREWTRRYRLGTHLLQELLRTAPPDEAAVRQYPPEYFYPLGPILSKHYFYERADVVAARARLVPPAAHVLHWYASVADLAPLDERYIESHRNTSVYAHLCAPFLP